VAQGFLPLYAGFSQRYYGPGNEGLSGVIEDRERATTAADNNRLADVELSLWYLGPRIVSIHDDPELDHRDFTRRLHAGCLFSFSAYREVEFLLGSSRPAESDVCL
jgi:hypothetical protein